MMHRVGSSFIPTLGPESFDWTCVKATAALCVADSPVSFSRTLRGGVGGRCVIRFNMPAGASPSFTRGWPEGGADGLSRFSCCPSLAAFVKADSADSPKGSGALLEDHHGWPCDTGGSPRTAAACMSYPRVASVARAGALVCAAKGVSFVHASPGAMAMVRRISPSCS